ncbi:MAG: TIR domain-containing protein, partial [Gammaproteobacteria bacterium]|nr:TIR domain-containing protein [Gammaproteobacteria bacterium]
MADIFVSYASEDRKRVEPLVELLKQQGWSVWWDRDLIAGPSFDREIEKALHEARCVVVVWSRHSIDSTWCRAEATDAQEREILVPVLVDDVRPPLAFRAAQSASMTGWPRSQDNVDRVFDGISACLGTPRPAPLKTSRGQKRSYGPVATIAGAVVLAAAALWAVIETQSPAEVPVAANHDVVRIAVLPFEDFSANGDNAHIAAGLQEDIISKLAEIGELEVTSRSSTRRFSQASERSIPEIARDLSVSHVVEGSIRRSADEVRVSVQLIDATTNSQRWAESYDRELTNLFAIQTDVAREVAHQLEKTFSNQTAEFAQQPTDDLQAYELVLKGRELLAVDTGESLAQAAELMAQAVARDPGLAEAHSGLSRALFLQSFINTTWSEVRTQALQASERALELDPDSASIHTNYAHIRGVWEGDQQTARQHYQKAIELEPNNSFSLLHYGAHLYGSGEVEKGLPFLQRAMTLDPLSGEISHYLAQALVGVGRIEDAFDVVERGLKFNPTYLHLRIFEIQGLEYTGDLTATF